MYQLSNIFWLILGFAIVNGQSKESFNTTPPPIRTNFICKGQPQGFYADIQNNCKVYHNCDDHGNRFSYRCPEGTLFRQDALICDHEHLVDCQSDIIALSTNREISSSDFLNDSKNDKNDDQEFKKPVFNKNNNNNINSKKDSFEISSNIFFGSATSQNSNKKYSSLQNFKNKPSTFFREDKTDFKKLEYEFQQLLPPFADSSSSFEHFDDDFKTTTEEADYDNQDYSFLQPPFPRFDNKFFSKDSFETEDFASISNEMNDSKEESEFADINPLTILLPPKETKNQQSSSRAVFNFRNDDYPYIETLKSIQKASLTTTEPSTESSKNPIKAYDHENDPYYPQSPTTEAHYTPRENEKFHKSFLTSTRQPFSSVKFEVPAVLPDLNSIEDLVDRRKLFFIPRTKSVK